jgi:hypothetical protein
VQIATIVAAKVHVNFRGLRQPELHAALGESDRTVSDGYVLPLQDVRNGLEQIGFEFQYLVSVG